jgi:hypothetical protein
MAAIITKLHVQSKERKKEKKRAQQLSANRNPT